MIETIINDIYYRLDEENLTAEVIKRKRYEFEGDIIIPETTVFNDVTYRVTSIGEHAFDCCSSLTTVVILDGVMSIEKRAFFGCQSLTNITIPASVTSIGTEAFYDCSSLTSIVLPDSVMSIEWWAFCRCESLTDITFQGTIAQWKKIKLRENWKDKVPAKVAHCTDGDVEI